MASKEHSALEHVPACSWPPAWLKTESSFSTNANAKPEFPEVPAGVSPWDLSPELFELWEERVCIMHFDGKVGWAEAEAMALTDVLAQSHLKDDFNKPVDEIKLAREGELMNLDEQVGPYGRA